MNSFIETKHKIICPNCNNIINKKMNTNLMEIDCPFCSVKLLVEMHIDALDVKHFKIKIIGG